MSLIQNLDFFIEGCHALGIRNWIISPGSRNAPIVARIYKSEKFNLFSVPDERAAAFIGLGGNLTTFETAILCTSGTAVANYYPAVCEAFYSQIPLFIVTADRPTSSIDTWDGQMIRQKDIFKTHAVGNWHLNSDLHSLEAKSEIEEIINQVNEVKQTRDFGPLHINIPIQEPIYKEVDLPFSENSFLLKEIKTTFENQQQPTIPINSKILVFAGQIPLNEKEDWQSINWGNSVVFAEKTSNLTSAFPNWELVLKEIPNTLLPTILITIGKNWIHKTLKEWIKNNTSLIHIHISKQLFVGNPFNTKLHHWKITQCNEISNWLNPIGDANYAKLWQDNLSKKPVTIPSSLFTKEFEAIERVFNANFDCIHLGNSMAIRIAGWLPKNNSIIYCNRGTSGIDGSLATAIGYAITHKNEKVACVLGDISMLYEHNSLWMDAFPQNLQIIVLNNGKGAIFDWIKGPEKLEKAKDYILTPHYYTLKYVCLHFNISYSCNEEHIGKSMQLIEVCI